MNDNLITDLEGKLGVKLPEDYRVFLLYHEHSVSERSFVFNPPRSGIIDHLLTIDEILENDRNNCIGIPDKQLLYIGSSIMGGFLYLKVSRKGFGEIHYMEEYTFRETFNSFGHFLKETHKEDAEPSDAPRPVAGQ